MNGRRSFFALVGSVAITGAAEAADTGRARLLLPPRLMTDAAPPMFGSWPWSQLIEAIAPSGRTLLDAEAASGHYSQLQAVMATKAGVPEDLFLDWLEGGLRMAKANKPGGSIYRARVLDGLA